MIKIRNNKISTPQTPEKLQLALTILTNIIIAATLLIISGSTLSAEPRFYISTDKIFSPGEEAAVTVESRELSYLDIRVYRIDDPKAFFLSQDKPHVPKEINEYAGANIIKIFTTVFNRDMTLLRNFPRRFINGKFRADILQTLEDLKNAMIPSEKDAIHSTIRILGKYPVLRHFRHNYFETRQRESFSGSSYTGENSETEENSENDSETYDSGEYSSNTWIYQKIPIYEKDPGVYLVEGVNGNHVGYSMVIISKYALITKQSGDSLLCCVVDKLTGQPAPNIPISVISNLNRQKINEGKTDNQGLFYSTVKNIPQLTIIAGNEKQFAIMDPTFFPVSTDHRKVYMYTDRPVYRPGQDVYYKGIVRDILNEAYNTTPAAPVSVSIIDPEGTLIAKENITINPMGTFNGHLQLNPDSRLGTYSLNADIDGKRYHAEFKIQEYKKPKFLVDVKLEGSGLTGSKVNSTIYGKYYFGPPVQNANLRYYIYRTRFYVPSWIDENFSWYYSEAEYRNTRQELIKEGQGKLNTTGTFNFSFDTKPDSQDYTYLVEVRVTDQSQYTVTSTSTINTSTAQFNIGIKSQKLVYTANQDVTVTFYTRDLNNQPIATGFDFNAIQIASVGKDANGNPQTKETPIFTKHLTTDATGKTTITFKPQKSGLITLVSRGLDKFNNIIQTNSTIWVASENQPVTYAGEGIEIVADKISYQPGENARFLVLSHIPNIPFLFTVEGGNLYYYKIHKFNGNSCLIEIPLKPLYSPNIYVQASAIFQDQFYQRQKTVIIPPADKILNVTIKPDKKIYQPGDTVKAQILVLDHKKQPVQAEVSLGVVDESIYSICPELVMDMQKFFYPRKRNNVRTNNSLVFNFYGFSEEVKPQLASLEMRSESGLSSFKIIFERTLRERFKDTSYWNPTITTAPDGTANVEFKLPDNITQWRFTARAINRSTQIGSAMEKIISRRDLTLQIDPPQTFTEGDELNLPVILKNTTNQPMPSGIFAFDIQGGKITADFPKTFSLPPYGTTVIPLKIKITGKGQATLSAWAKYGNTFDGVKLPIPITSYGVETVLSQTITLSPTEKTKTLKFNLSEEGYNRFLKGQVYFHTGIYRAILSSLNYLSTYPYGCVEQTMSGFLPDLVLSQILEKQKISNLPMKQNVDRYIYSGIKRLLEFQGPNGGWGWFDEATDTNSDHYTTAYVMYGLTLARNLGYELNEDRYARGIQALEKQIAQKITPEIRITSLYDLALADHAPISIIMDEYKKRDTLSPYSIAILILALDKTGKTKEAQTLTDLLLTKCTYNEQNQTAFWKSTVKYRLLSENAEIETTAFALQALLKTRPKDNRILPAARWLLSQRQGERWHSTRDTAAAAIALSEYIGNRGLNEKINETLRYRLNNKNWYTIPSELLYSDKGESSMYLMYNELKIGENTIEIEKTKDSELFVSFALLYYSTQQDVKTQTGPLKISRYYYKLSAVSEKEDKRWNTIPFNDIDNITVKPSEEFLVRLEVDPTQPYDYMMLEDFIPSGFQIIDSFSNYTFAEEYLQHATDQPKYTYDEIRDNRIVFFFNQLKPNEKFSVIYLLRATVEGEYEVNPAVIRSMYHEERRALSNRFHVIVKPDKK